MTNSPIERLFEAVNAAGIPNEGCRQAAGGPLEIIYAAGATPQQQAQGATIIAGLDTSPRRPKGLAALRAEVGALTNAQKNNLFEAIAARFLQENPKFARRLGLAVDGDEPGT